jgi:DNA-binding winged helix-turn-helix (wHTH) protein/pimeloyl-ACP methyl ester carboxylesterase
VEQKPMRYRFGNHVLDVKRRELYSGNERIQIEPQVFDLLLHLIENRERVVTKDDLIADVWHGRIVSESTLTSRITAARHAVGDSGVRQELIRTIPRRGVRFVGDVLVESTSPRPEVAAREATNPNQEVSFCKTMDGVHLAVASTGSGPPVVKTANWLTHIEFDWQSPVWSPLQHRLTAEFRLIRYDQRGTGLSKWEVDDISFEAFVRDLEAVVDGLGLDRFALFGISQGAAVSIAYATRHPERVNCLVLAGGYARGWRKRGTPEQIAQREAMMTLMQDWGKDNPAFRQLFTSLLIPDANIEEMRWFNDVQRVSTSTDNAVQLMRVFGDIDVTDLLEKVAVPTLVLHSRDDALIPLEQGLLLGRMIHNARFVGLDSRNHLILSHEDAWPHYLEEICTFIRAVARG